jgi:hypothetical protein
LTGGCRAEQLSQRRSGGASTPSSCLPLGTCGRNTTAAPSTESPARRLSWSTRS